MNNTWNRAAAAACVLAAAVLLPRGARAALQTAHVALAAPAAIHTGDTFVVRLVITNSPEIAGFEASIRFDPGSLELLGCVPGGFLGATGNPATTYWTLPSVAAANAAGAITNLAAVCVGTNTARGGGVLCSFAMRERGVNSNYAARLRFEAARTRLADPAGRDAIASWREAAIVVTGDTDADGLPDDWELAALGTLAWDGTGDADGDGESNAAEQQGDTDPFNARSAGSPTNRYDKFRFELRRHAMETPSGALADWSSYGLLFGCAAPRPGAVILGGSLEIPEPGSGRRALPLEVAADGSAAGAAVQGAASLAQLQQQCGSGTYRAALRLREGDETNALRFALAVAPYAETNFPPFERILSPAAGAAGIGLSPTATLASAAWEYLGIREPGDGDAYQAANLATSSTHVVTNELPQGAALLLSVANRDPAASNWLASCTWTWFSTAFKPVRFTVVSAYGSASPTPGVYTNARGTVLTNWVSAAVAQAGTQHLCAGWALSGQGPAAGTSNRMVLTLATDAQLAWQWTTNYWLAATAGGRGTVQPDSGWQPAGAGVVVTATPAPYVLFANWAGDVPVGAESNRAFVLTMAGPRAVEAVFQALLATNGVPLWWLAAHGWTNSFDSAATNDQDVDGHATWKEWFANTDPTNARSVLRALASRLGTNGDVVICWPVASNRFYSLWRSTNLADGFREVTNDVVPCYTDRVDNVRQRFYRIGVRP